MKIVKSVIYIENSTYTVGQIENVIPGITSLHLNLTQCLTAFPSGSIPHSSKLKLSLSILSLSESY